jgi:hypothetical protein
MISLRYLTLTALWLVPLFFLGLNQLQSEEAMMTMMASSSAMGPPVGFGKFAFIIVLYFLGSIITPPLFLIISVSAGSFGEIFSPEHWRNRFSGRMGDLFLVYVVYAGAMGMILILGFPLVIGLFPLSWKLAAFFGAIGVAFVLGLAINLLGRLCGFFAFGESGFSPQAEAPGPDYGPAMHRTGPDSVAPVAPATPAAAPVATADPERTIPLSSDPAAQALADAANAAMNQGLPPLMDAQQKVNEATQRFESDPEGAIRQLKEVRDAHAPHPQVLHALCLLAHKAGRTEDALCHGKEALPICLDRGHAVLAAEIFRTLWSLREQLDLTRDQTLAVAAAMVKQGDLTYGANTYALILQKDTKETRAVKGILQVAEKLLKESRKPADALRLYQYLLKHCPDSPLAEFMHQGEEEAKKMVEQAKAS